MKVRSVKSESSPKVIHHDMAVVMESLRRNPPHALVEFHPKLTASMNLKAVVNTMSEGLKDARMLCEKILKIGKSIDSSDPLMGIRVLALLDAAGIRGRKMETLYHACGGEQPEEFLGLVLAVHKRIEIPYGDPQQKAIINIADLKRMSEPTTVTGGVFRLADKSELKLSNVLLAVKREFPNFDLRNQSFSDNYMSKSSRHPRPRPEGDPSEKIG